MYSEILFDVVAVAVAMFVMITSYRTSKRCSRRLKYLSELEDYCLELRHRFGENNILADAVFSSFDPKRKMIRDYTYAMTRVFGNDRTDGMTAEGYGESLDEPYEKLLVSVCRLVDEYGDNKGAPFGETILKMVLDIREERRHLSKRSHGFKGLSVTAAVPCLFVRSLGGWGMDTIPSLIPFYHGRGGVYLRCAVAILTFLCGMAVQIMADPLTSRKLFGIGQKSCGVLRIGGKRFKSINKFIRQKLEKLDIRVGVGRIWFLSFVFAGAFFVFSLASVLLGHIDMRNDFIYETSDTENSLRIADSAQINAARRVIPYLTESTVYGGKTYTYRELIDEIQSAGITGEEEAGMVAAEYYERLDGYEKEKTDLTDLVFVIGMGLAGWFVPIAGMIVLGVVLDSRIKEEVMQFESVIDMEKDVNGMTVPVMLESMLAFASVTKGALIKTIMDYNTSEARAFNNLSEFSDDRSLKRLAGFFSMTDMLGIKHAFDEVSEELASMREERSLDRNMRLEDEVMFAGILGVIPGGLVVFGYLLVPFVVRSLEMFNTYSDSLGMI